MAPDFEYFARMKMYGHFGHTFIGMFAFDLPMVLVMAFIYHNLIRNMLIDNLPLVLKKRLVQFTNFNWSTYFRKNLLIVIYSALLGIASHIFWDSFTHDTGYFVQNLPLLKRSVAFAGLESNVFRFLQNGSSVVGLAGVVVWILTFQTDNNVKKKSILLFWTSVTGISLAALAFRAAGGLSISRYNDIVVSAITAFFVGILLTSIIYKYKGNRQVYETN